MNRISSRTLTLLALAMVAAPALMGQELTGQMVGHVKTPAGEPVAGAEVRLSSPVLQGVRVVVTDARGAFRAPLLPPGSYTVAASKAGMVSNPIHGVTVGLGQTVNQDVPMASASASAVVEVVGTAARVDKTDVKASTNVTSEDMDLLPRTTRGLNTVALLAPGVVLNTANGVNRVQIRGGQGTGNRFLLNGTDISDNAFGTSDGRQFFVDDSVAETQVIQSPINARYGGFTGGVVNAITKVGGNEFSGTIRANISRPNWIAIAPLGMRNGGANAKPAPGVDDASRAYTIFIGGPVIKDRLWFTASTKLDPAQGTTVQWANPNTSGGTNTGDGAGAGPAYLTGAGGNHTQVSSTQFYELKLTGMINQNHTVEASGSRQVLSIANRQYLSGSDGSGSFDPATLNIGSQIYEYYALAYRGILSNAANLDVRYANKHQVFISGGDPKNGPTIFARYSNGAYYQFNNGIFNIADGGDNRDIGSYNANLQWFSPQTSLGSHQVDMGFEILRQERKAANDQAPTNQRFRVWGRNADGTYRAAGLLTSATAGSQNVYRAYFSDRGVAKTNLDAYYINDVWSITNRFQLSMGIRYDKVSAADTLGSKTISSSQISPRTKFTYDIKGDQAWLASASYARYTAKLQDGFANQFTLAGNPIQENYGWLGAANNALTTADVINLANWNISAAGLQGVSSPATNTIDSKTKAPYSDEMTLGLRRGYNDGSFLSFTYVKRVSRHFFNDFLYIQDLVNVPLRATAVPTTAPVTAVRWGNDDRLVRDYRALEFEFAARFDANWNLGGNYTYSSLKGNGEGSEGQASTLAVSGDVIGDYESVHARRGRDSSYYAPYGALLGDRPHKATLHLDYSNKSAQGGAFTASLLFNYLSGATYSLTRTNAFEVQADAQDPTQTANPATLAFAQAQYGTTYTRYFGPRGIGRYNDTYNFDLKVGVDVPVVRNLRYFLELTFFNVFNHWQQHSYSIAGAAGNGTLPTNGALSAFSANGLNTTASSASYGTGFGTYGFGDMVGGRSVVLSTGIKW